MRCIESGNGASTDCLSIVFFIGMSGLREIIYLMVPHWFNQNQR